MARRFAAVQCGGPGRKQRKGIKKRRPLNKQRTRDMLAQQQAALERERVARRKAKAKERDEHRSS
jgi:hypothetical protein